MDYRPDIDGLRAIAILAVVGFHAGVPQLSGGYVGVDIFFVISGFLITTLIDKDLRRDRFTIIGFYERRARRILPALFVMVVACFGIGWFILLDEAFERLARSALSVLGFYSNVYFWIDARNYFAASSDFEPLLHTWSLAVEEQFYILFPILMILLRRWSDHGRMIVLAMLALCSLGVSMAAIQVDEAAAFYLAPSRFFELTIGALLALRHSRPRWLSGREDGLAILGMMAILASIWLYDQTTAFPGLAAALPALGTAFIIHAGSGKPTLINRFLACRPLVFIGLISYSLYLWHWPLLAFWRVRLGTVDLPAHHTALAILLAFALAWLSWRLVEQPFRDRQRIASKQVVAMAASGGSVIAALSFLVWVHQGLPTRIPQAARLLADAKEDRNPRRDACFHIRAGDDLCRLGAPDRPVSFLLWGDSHADAFMPAVDLAAALAGKAGLFVGTSACPPLLGVTPVERNWSDCHAFNDAVAAMLRQRADIDEVILVARWAIYAEPSLTAEGPSRFRLNEQGADDVSGDIDNPAVFKRGLRRTMDVLLAEDKAVSILGGVPEIGWDVPALLARASWWGDALPPIPDKTDVARRNAAVEKALFEASADRHVRFVPTADLLCQPDCIVSHQGKPLYYDADHISLYAAKTVFAPALKERIWGQSE